MATQFAVEAANEKAASLLATECSVIRRPIITAIFNPSADVYSACAIRLPVCRDRARPRLLRKMGPRALDGCPMSRARMYMRGDAS